MEFLTLSARSDGKELRYGSFFNLHIFWTVPVFYAWCFPILYHSYTCHVYLHCHPHILCMSNIKVAHGDENKRKTSIGELDERLEAGIDVKVLKNGGGKWPRRVRRLLLALADPWMQLEPSELLEASIAAEAARDVALCRETLSKPSDSSHSRHECLACGWEVEELTKIETRALRALLHLPNPARVNSDTSVDLNTISSETAEIEDQDGEKDEEHATLLSRGSVQASMVVCEANFLVSECFAAVMRRATEKEAWKVDLIGSHGQTIWHHPSSAKLLPSLSVKKNGTHTHINTPKEEGLNEIENPTSSSATPSHRQHHQHLGKISSTLQIGDGSVLSARMGVTCVSNFRSADVARGGQGAPLTSSLDSFLLSHLAHTSQGWVALQNLGGMGNVTLIPSHALVMTIAHHNMLHRQQKSGTTELGPNEEQEEKENGVQSFSASIHPIAFDTGPANVLLDWFVSTHIDTQAEYDQNGAHAARGRVNETLLLHMLQHPYFALSTPKTCGREVFTAALGESWWIECKDGRYGEISEKDFLATLTDLTAVSVVISYLRFTPRVHHANWYLKPAPSTTLTSPHRHFSPFPSHIYISGGGSHNAHLMSRIEHYARLAQQGKLDSFERLLFGDDSASAFLVTLQQSPKRHGEESHSHQLQEKVESPPSNLQPLSSSPLVSPSPHIASEDVKIHPAIVSSHTSTGISADEKESVLFALLAFFSLYGVPSSIPACTGAHEAAVLGNVAPGLNWRALMKRVLE